MSLSLLFLTAGANVTSTVTLMQLRPERFVYVSSMSAVEPLYNTLQVEDEGKTKIERI